MTPPDHPLQCEMLQIELNHISFHPNQLKDNIQSGLTLADD